ncbi:YbaB/EbfC family nucleoid-associated protein [Candidatus Gottesmanbacteria bacterium]|nr:YbaB/EbfC family nucleoid-associated protein [Candidatus Gottesmanbacteria bacterium]
MINPLKGLGDLNEMRKKAMAMQQALAAERVTIDKDGVHIVMTGDQKIVEFTIDGYEPEDRVKNAIQEAIKKAQEVAAKKLTEISGGLGGLLGR